MAEPGARSIWLIADDYGFSPGVSETIRALLEAGRLSGTGCMTLFDDWSNEAGALATIGGPFAVGMHLTLTDFPALSTGRTMPDLKRLLGNAEADAIMSEADLERLVREQAKAGDMVVCLGAGTISGWANNLPGRLQRKAG